MGKTQGYPNLWRDIPGAGMQASEKGHPLAGAAVPVRGRGRHWDWCWGCGQAGVGSLLHGPALLFSSSFLHFLYWLILTENQLTKETHSFQSPREELRRALKLRDNSWVTSTHLALSQDGQFGCKILHGVVGTAFVSDDGLPTVFWSHPSSSSLGSALAPGVRFRLRAAIYVSFENQGLGGFFFFFCICLSFWYHLCVIALFSLDKWESWLRKRNTCK